MTKQEKNCRMARAYRNGLLLKEISLKFGISLQAVQQRLASVGVTHNDRPQSYQMIDKERLASMYAKNVSLNEIARQFGVYLKTIEKALKYHQIPKRRRIKTSGHRIEILKQLEIGDTYVESLGVEQSYMWVYTSAKRAGIKTSARRITKLILEVTRIE